MSDSRWGDLFKHLEEKGFDVYSPGVKLGDCTSPYIVIRLDNADKHTSFSTNVWLYSILCYVPRDSYSAMEPMVLDVQKYMKELEPMFLPHGQQSPSYYDDTYKAHMVSITYKNYKKML